MEVFIFKGKAHLIGSFKEKQGIVDRRKEMRVGRELIFLIAMVCLSGMFLMGQNGPCTPPPPQPRERIVFVTPGGTHGNLGGISAADNACQIIAELCFLPGTFKAWLSDSTQSPSTSFTQDGMFKNIDGNVIAHDWADLTEGFIDHPIDLDCAGTYIAVEGVWTGTDWDGTQTGGGNPSSYCNDWTSSSSAISAVNGNTAFIDAQWTNEGFYNCSESMRLYCFQQ